MKFSIEDWRLSIGLKIVEYVVATEDDCCLVGLVATEDDCCKIGLRYMDVEGCGSSIISELDSFTYL